eukprot:gnl/MRDRNA2_/MRDRNA2_14208_c0_seq1.p1 gnl/MRDRNA2_/MRDRNA2_14208_c0~~gnl/MRDRNA2_/MRDRNA2_14208_c0_seq1.p1  ORF type:complete len:694 (+),score=101.96 gnl/MRDRNA2_/MRDRNA2_14208_c0_seq1:77-2158(+)
MRDTAKQIGVDPRLDMQLSNLPFEVSDATQNFQERPESEMSSAAEHRSIDLEPVALLERMLHQQRELLNSHHKELEKTFVRVIQQSIAKEIRQARIGSLQSHEMPAAPHPQIDISDLSYGSENSKKSVKSVSFAGGCDIIDSDGRDIIEPGAHSEACTDTRHRDSKPESHNMLTMMKKALTNTFHQFTHPMERSNSDHKDLEDHAKKVGKSLHKVNTVAAHTHEHHFSWMLGSRGGPRGKIAKVIHSSYCEALVLLVIVSNTMYMAWETDWVARSLENPEDAMPWIRSVELFFTIFFCIDLALRIYVETSSFFSNKNASWNALDTLVVAIALLEEVMRMLSSGSTAVSSTKVIRVLRILRLIRIVRFIRGASAFAELRAMCMGIYETVGSLFWAIVLIFIVIFVFSIYLTQGVAFYLIDIDYTHDSDVDALLQSIAPKNVGFESQLRINFGSLVRTMYSLWKAISGGSDWQTYGDALFTVSSGMGVIFCLYITFAVCALLNVVTGIFVNKAIKIAEGDMYLKLLDHNESRKGHIEAVKSVFLKADIDEDGTLSRDEFENHFDNPFVQAFFTGLDLDLDGIRPGQLFDLLDFDNDKHISVSEFIYGCSTMKGYARNLDLSRLASSVSQKHEKLVSMLNKHEEFVSVLKKMYVNQVNAQDRQQSEYQRLQGISKSIAKSISEIGKESAAQHKAQL